MPLIDWGYANAGTTAHVPEQGATTESPSTRHVSRCPSPARRSYPHATRTTAGRHVRGDQAAAEVVGVEQSRGAIDDWLAMGMTVVRITALPALTLGVFIAYACGSRKAA